VKNLIKKLLSQLNKILNAGYLFIKTKYLFRIMAKVQKCLRFPGWRNLGEHALLLPWKSSWGSLLTFCKPGYGASHEENMELAYRHQHVWPNQGLMPHAAYF
jgi:hypothetical protein